MTKKYTNDQIKAALQNSGGIYTIAADKLKCAPNTVKNYIKRSKKLQEFEREIVEANIDIAEAELLKAIRGGNMTAIIFYLKTKAKSRGYIERHEHSGPDGSAIPVKSPLVELKSRIDGIAARIGPPEAVQGADRSKD